MFHSVITMELYQSQRSGSCKFIRLEFSRLIFIYFISDFKWKQLPMILDIKGQVVVALELR